jgi:hypothetical protein
MSKTQYVQAGFAEVNGSEKGDYRRDRASSFYGEASRVQPDRAGFSGIAQAVADYVFPNVF